MTSIVYDGRKAVNLDLLMGDTGWITLGNNDAPPSDEVRRLYETVGLLFQCTHIRAKSLSKVPWAITNGGDTVIWEQGTAVPPNLRWLGTLPRLLRKTEAAMVLASQAYWHIERNRVTPTALRWFAPIATQPRWDVQLGLTHFVRNTGAATANFPVEDICYLRYEHPLHETLRDVSPAEAAMRAAGVLYNVDEFVSKFFERGAIKATLLTVKGNPPKSEMERIKNWWTRFFQGISNAFGAEVLNAEGITPVVVGEGIGELSNTDLTGEKRNDIAITLGVPLSMVFSDAANYATASQDEQNFYNSTIVPDCDLISEQVNEQLLEPMGLHLVFKPETMDVFQTDENAKAASFKVYVDAGIKLSIAAEMMGLELPDGVEYEDLDAAKEEADAAAQAQADAMLAASQQNTPPAQEGDPALQSEQRRFKAWAKKRPDADPAKFVSRLLSESDKVALLSDMGVAAEQPFFTGVITPETYKAMVLQLDPSDDEKERTIRMALERRSARSISESFAEMLDTLYPQGYDFQEADAEAQRAHDEFMSNQALQDALNRALLDSTDLGVSVAVDQLQNIGYGFDWTLANLAARDWAQQHTGQLISGLSDTTARGVRQAVARFAENGEPLEALIQDLTPYFGRKRAERVASTEVTRAYQQGSEAAWRQSGVVDQMEWVTVNDEKVCPQCGPMDEQRAPLGGTFNGSSPPPLHVQCRCFTRPVIKES